MFQFTERGNSRLSEALQREVTDQFYKLWPNESRGPTEMGGLGNAREARNGGVGSITAAGGFGRGIGRRLLERRE